MTDSIIAGSGLGIYGAKLRAEPDIEVVGQGETVEDAFRLGTELLPDILLLDISIPGGGLNAIPRIAPACPVTKIVMLTVSEEEDDVIAAALVAHKVQSVDHRPEK